MYKYLPMSAASKLSVALLIAMSSALAACSNGELALDDTYAPATHYERFPIAVAKGPMKLEVSSPSGILKPTQIDAITGFSRLANTSGGTKITILRPSAGGASGKVAKQAYQLLLQSGIPPVAITQKTYPGPSKGPVRISFVRSVAITKECGDWSSDLANTSANTPYPNLGCSMQNNIAAMVVNPDDFAAPRPTAQAWAASRYPSQFGYNPVNKY